MLQSLVRAIFCAASVLKTTPIIIVPGKLTVLYNTYGIIYCIKVSVFKREKFKPDWELVAI